MLSVMIYHIMSYNFTLIYNRQRPQNKTALIHGVRDNVPITWYMLHYIEIHDDVNTSIIGSSVKLLTLHSDHLYSLGVHLLRPCLRPVLAAVPDSVAAVEATDDAGLVTRDTQHGALCGHAHLPVPPLSPGLTQPPQGLDAALGTGNILDRT